MYFLSVCVVKYLLSAALSHSYNHLRVYRFIFQIHLWLHTLCFLQERNHRFLSVLLCCVTLVEVNMPAALTQENTTASSSADGGNHRKLSLFTPQKIFVGFHIYGIQMLSVPAFPKQLFKLLLLRTSFFCLWHLLSFFELKFIPPMRICFFYRDLRNTNNAMYYFYLYTHSHHILWYDKCVL